MPKLCAPNFDKIDFVMFEKNMSKGTLVIQSA